MEALPEPFDFTNKVVLVTGSGRGLGRHLALRFSEAGASVAVHHRASRTGAKAVAQEITGRDRRGCIVQADLALEDDVDRTMKEVREELGPLDILIHNAGEYPSTHLLDLTTQEWDRVIASNLRSTFLTTQAAARQMIDMARAGAIVNIASIEADFPAPGHSHYSAAKAGVVMLTRSSAWTLG